MCHALQGCGHQTEVVKITLAEEAAKSSNAANAVLGARDSNAVEKLLGAFVDASEVVAAVVGGAKTKPMKGQWHSTLKGGVTLDVDDTVAKNGGSDGHAVLSATCIPPRGQTYVEVTYSKDSDGSSMGSCYYTVRECTMLPACLVTPFVSTLALLKHACDVQGLVSKDAASGDLSRDYALKKLSGGFWGVDDSGSTVCRGEGVDSSSLSGSQKTRSGKFFLSADTVGMMVDMDHKQLTFYINGVLVPDLIFDGLVRTPRRPQASIRRKPPRERAPCLPPCWAQKHKFLCPTGRARIGRQTATQRLTVCAGARGVRRCDAVQPVGFCEDCVRPQAPKVPAQDGWGCREHGALHRRADTIGVAQ
eukprot:SAG11_NODE_1446_length_4891_cov_1.703673_1_plen_362_part_00